MRENNKPSIAKTAFVIAFLISPAVFADVSPLCNDLARFACAPGSYKDGTGEIKSESEISRFMSSYAEKSRTTLRSRFDKLFNDPVNSYFKDVAIAGLGLKNSPQCASSEPREISACRENLLDGLTTIAQKQALGPLMPRTGLERQGNLKDLNYIIKNNAYQKVIQELNDQVQKDLGNPEMNRKIQDKVFPKIKDLIIARLKRLSIPDEQRNLMISKVNSISFEGTSCEEVGGGRWGRSNGEVVSSLLVPNAFYDPQRNIFKLCSGYLLQSTSDFQIATTIAHELSHSIDPCNVARGPADMGFKYSNPQDLKKMEQEYPIKNVIQCLRDRRSIGAINFNSPDPNQNDPGACPGCSAGGMTSMPYVVVNKNSSMPMPSGQYGGMGGGGSSGRENPKADFCDGDQIGESFSDWMAVEVLPVYIEQNYRLTIEQYRLGYANARRLICSVQEDGGRSNRDEHPAIENRINKIILVNPKVRAQMGCPSKHPENAYCDSETPIGSPDEPQRMVPAVETKPTGSVPPTGSVR